VPAFDQGPLRAQRVQRLGRVALGLLVDDVDADEQPDLVQIRGHQRGQREELGAQCLQGARMQQWVTVHGRAHRVDHQRGGADLAEVAPGAGDGLDDRR
jgi:hypothetical protein